MEQVHFNPGGDRPRELDDLSRGECGHVAIHGDHGSLRGEKMRGRGALGDEGGGAGLLSEQIIPCLAPAMRDEPLRHRDAFFPCPDEALAPDQGVVPRVGSGDLHGIRRIWFTNFPQPCHNGSAAGRPYLFSYVCTVASTSSLVMFSWLIPIPNTFPPPMFRV